ncbi:hypothetical protein EP47_08895 [Legionella norrlandica]|uniref:Uncharacterized protein n=1 Tax=Legionella norrlandica TaxID=1498499 RepID=A0A0A2SS79_9GAMM|nr:hypothetical protein [Legionella norrlandica]KGP62591.1 hypothetical protein EP47_08895 [Legionella norrlandica]
MLLFSYKKTNIIEVGQQLSHSVDPIHRVGRLNLSLKVITRNQSCSEEANEISDEVKKHGNAISISNFYGAISPE